METKDKNSNAKIRINAIIVIEWDYKNSFYFQEYQQLHNLASLS